MYVSSRTSTIVQYLERPNRPFGKMNAFVFIPTHQTIDLTYQNVFQSTSVHDREENITDRTEFYIFPEDGDFVILPRVEV